MSKIIEKDKLVPGKWYFWTRSKGSPGYMAAIKIKSVGEKVKYSESFTGFGIHKFTVSSIKGTNLIEIDPNNLDDSILEWINNLPDNIKITLPF